MKGVALLCSVPPSGSGGIVGRYFLRKPLTALDITLVHPCSLRLSHSARADLAHFLAKLPELGSREADAPV
jgi:hypothetical protein